MNFKYVLAAIFFCFFNYEASAQGTVNSKPTDGVYFVKRNANIDSTKYKLYSSIRPSDKKDIKDSTIIIRSNGEGWLDKDSLPVGQWSFFAMNESNKPYMLKTGNYKKTKNQMFVFSNDDYANMKEYGFTPDSLQKDFAGDYPFIKTGTWHYYHSNGKIWKQVSFESNDLFLNIAFISEKGEFDNEHITKVMVSEKEKDDEWPKEEIDEYIADGYLFKKLFLSPTCKIIYKVIFDNTGKIIHEYTDFHAGINSTNF